MNEILASLTPERIGIILAVVAFIVQALTTYRANRDKSRKELLLALVVPAHDLANKLAKGDARAEQFVRTLDQLLTGMGVPGVQPHERAAVQALGTAAHEAAKSAAAQAVVKAVTDQDPFDKPA